MEIRYILWLNLLFKWKPHYIVKTVKLMLCLSSRFIVCHNILVIWCVFANLHPAFIHADGTQSVIEMFDFSPLMPIRVPKHNFKRFSISEWSNIHSNIHTKTLDLSNTHIINNINDSLDLLIVFCYFFINIILIHLLSVCINVYIHNSHTEFINSVFAYIWKIIDLNSFSRKVLFLLFF